MLAAAQDPQFTRNLRIPICLCDQPQAPFRGFWHLFSINGVKREIYTIPRSLQPPAPNKKITLILATLFRNMTQYKQACYRVGRQGDPTSA